MLVGQKKKAARRIWSPEKKKKGAHRRLGIRHVPKSKGGKGGSPGMLEKGKKKSSARPRVPDMIMKG